MMAIIFILSTSCATAEWRLVTIEHRLMDWRLCSDIDGKYDNEGFCFISKQCRRIIMKSCRPITHFCKFRDKECYRKWNLDIKRLSSTN